MRPWLVWTTTSTATLLYTHEVNTYNRSLSRPQPNPTRPPLGQYQGTCALNHLHFSSVFKSWNLERERFWQRFHSYTKVLAKVLVLYISLMTDSQLKKKCCALHFVLLIYVKCRWIALIKTTLAFITVWLLRNSFEIWGIYEVFPTDRKNFLNTFGKD